MGTEMCAGDERVLRELAASIIEAIGMQEHNRFMIRQNHDPVYLQESFDTLADKVRKGE
jgi:hypothetical protein